MSREAKKVATKKITKSIRLTPEEAGELSRLVEGTAYAEAALMRRWVLDGMKQFRVSEAIGAYQADYFSVREAAKQAQVPVAILLEEMAARKVRHPRKLRRLWPRPDGTW